MCDRVATISLTTQIHILQHPTEVGLAKGTARLLELALPTVKIYGGETEHDFADIKTELLREQRTGHSVWVLFPSQQALSLSRTSVKTAYTSPPKHLIVIDGTWRKAKKIFALNPWIHQFEQVALNNVPESTYTIRKAPSASSLSTLEAVAELVEIIETVDMTPLRQLFHFMISKQMEQMPEDVKGRYLLQK
ncbi:tRNA-uridine aminocarboxypropyltransferase [Corallincola platygyrae]